MENEKNVSPDSSSNSGVVDRSCCGVLRDGEIPTELAVRIGLVNDGSISAYIERCEHAKPIYLHTEGDGIVRAFRYGDVERLVIVCRRDQLAETLFAALQREQQYATEQLHRETEAGAPKPAL